MYRAIGKPKLASPPFFYPDAHHGHLGVNDLPPVSEPIDSAAKFWKDGSANYDLVPKVNRSSTILPFSAGVSRTAPSG